MNNEPSIVTRTESTFDNFVDLSRRRPFVCIVVIVIPTLWGLDQQLGERRLKIIVGAK
jgi:hypothetical protein